MITVPKWNIEAETGYKPFTTFWADFSVADNISQQAIRDTFQIAFDEWKDNYRYFTELVLVLNHKSWQYYGEDDEIAWLYSHLYRIAERHALNYFTEEEMDYYYRVTD